jgi:hypothetical protein
MLGNFLNQATRPHEALKAPIRGLTPVPAMLAFPLLSFFLCGLASGKPRARSLRTVLIDPTNTQMDHHCRRLVCEAEILPEACNPQKNPRLRQQMAVERKAGSSLKNQRE